jgi:hypothetical protein
VRGLELVDWLIVYKQIDDRIRIYFRLRQAAYPARGIHIIATKRYTERAVHNIGHANPFLVVKTDLVLGAAGLRSTEPEGPD